MHFEDYTHEAINKVEKQFIQNIRQSQDIFNKRMSKQIKVPQQSALTLNADKIKDYITIIESYSLKDTPKQILFERISSNQIIERYRKNSKLNVEDFNKLKTLIEALRSYQ